jgi:hypothetical protein
MVPVDTLTSRVKEKARLFKRAVSEHIIVVRTA